MPFKKTVSRKRIIDYLLILLFLLQVECSQISNYLPYSFIIKFALLTIIVPFIIISKKLNNIKFHLIIIKDKIKFKYLLLIIIILLLSLTFSLNKEFGYLFIINFLIGTLPSILLLIYITKIIDNNMIKVITYYLIAGSIFFITFLYLTNSLTYTGNYELTNLEFSHVIASRILSPITLYLNYLVASSDNKRKRYKLFLLALYLNTGLIFIAHRASVLGVMLITLLFFKYNNKLIISSILLLSVLFSFLFFSYRLERFHKLYSLDKSDDYSIISRIELWKIAIDKIKEKPLLGYGMGGYKYSISEPAVHIYKYPHNIFLEVQSEIGIIGTILLFILIYKILITTYKISPAIFSIALLAFWWSLFSKDISTQTILFINIGFITKK